MRDSIEKLGPLIDKTMETVSDMSTRVKVIESDFIETKVVVDSRTKEIEAMIKDITIEINQEVNIVAEETCKADFTKKASTCCPDCKKAAFRVPPKQECEEAGCDHSCAFVNATCDKKKKKLKHSCMTPFKYLGVEQKSCITASPFGDVLRPWCYLDTKENTDRAADGKEGLDIGFCDCTELRCFCPPGQRLGPDRKKCVDVALVQVHNQEHSNDKRGWEVLNPELKASDW